MEKRRVGRPNVENPMNYEMRCKVRKEIHDEIIKRCNEEGITIADFLRRSINLYLKASEGFSFSKLFLKEKE